MPIECYTTVSDLAICQRCPALFAYKIHRHEQKVWKIGIKGSGESYGTVFHREISEKFFQAASNPSGPLYDEINSAASEGADSLERFIRDKIFIPFVEAKADFFTTSQILAMARAVRVWIRGMLIFFEGSRPVFLKPEVKLEGVYKFQDSNLIIKGRYDALIFNPEKIEARLFEFKGFARSDITVPLSQTLIYAWLLHKASGIIPSIEIIYLDEKRPNIFNFSVVREMILSGLPGLFRSALDVILLRRRPEIMRDKRLCDRCKFKYTCEEDMKKIFESKSKARLGVKRRGASLLSLMIFFMAAILITTQIFFFSNISSESVKDDRDIQSVRIQLMSLVEDARKKIKDNPSNYETGGTTMDWENFSESGKSILGNDSVKVYGLDYNYEDKTLNDSDIHWIDLSKRIFPAIEKHFLVRAHRQMPMGNNFMIQALINESGDVKTYEEIWWDNKE